MGNGKQRERKRERRKAKRKILVWPGLMRMAWRRVWGRPLTLASRVRLASVALKASEQA